LKHGSKLDRPVDLARDHVIGRPDADVTLVEYGSYACQYCHAAHLVVRNLRERFGDRMRYVYRHLPLADRELATHAAELAEYSFATGGDFWTAHDALMERSHRFDDRDLDQVAAALLVPVGDARDPEIGRGVGARVRDDAKSGIRSGARATPTFFINDKRYDGAWDEASLADAISGSVGHRLRAATTDFARWAPSTGVLLLLMTVIAIVVTNTAAGPAFESFWATPAGFAFGDGSFTLSLVDWVNHGLLSVFFLVVGLEMKREFTVGQLATRREAALPIAAALGGMTVPALIYVALISSGPLADGWGLTIATDTAFAVALIVVLGDRVPVELRVFLTAAVIVDDLVAIAVIALFYSDAIVMANLVGAAIVTAMLVALNRWNIYRALPYAALGIILWALLHAAGIHATLAGVILAVVTPTRPPPDLRALMAQAESVIDGEILRAGGQQPREVTSHATLEALDTIHDRIESPASKLLRTMEPWSSYLVLPVFALANAGVAWSSRTLTGRGSLVVAIVLGLVVGKPVGILGGAWIASRFGIAIKPASYSWRQLLGAGALGGIGFTMSLFIAAHAFGDEADFNAAKIAIFLASLIASILGVLILWRRRDSSRSRPPASPGRTRVPRPL
jgi:NhaA family Na+:H+ antiporter